MNYDAIDAGAKQVHEVEVPESWKSCQDEGLFTPEVKGGRADVVDFVKKYPGEGKRHRKEIHFRYLPSRIM